MGYRTMSAIGIDGWVKKYCSYCTDGGQAAKWNCTLESLKCK